MRRAYRQTAGPQRGFHVPHGRDTTGVDAIYTPGPRCPHVTSFRSHAGWPSIVASAIFRRRLALTEPQRWLPGVHPSGLPLARLGWMVHPLLRRYPELRTPPLPATRVGMGDRLWTLAWWQPFLCHTRTVRPRVAQGMRASHPPASVLGTPRQGAILCWKALWVGEARRGLI